MSVTERKLAYEREVARLRNRLYREHYPVSEYPTPLSKTALFMEYDWRARKQLSPHNPWLLSP